MALVTIAERNSTGSPKTPEALRFFANVQVTGSCWFWTKRLNKYGYGTFKRADGTTVLAHRWAFHYLTCSVPPVLDHVCRNRRCVNPDHLEPVTGRTNTLRGLSGHLKTHCKEGHLLAGDNLHWESPGRGRPRVRRCITCRSANRARFEGKRNGVHHEQVGV